MSDAPSTRPKVATGQTRYLTTRQKAANEKGYVGYDTIWESFQKRSNIPPQNGRKTFGCAISTGRAAT